MQRTLIVGASRGIGLSLSQVYKALGHQVIGTTRTPNDALESAVQFIDAIHLFAVFEFDCPLSE